MDVVAISLQRHGFLNDHRVQGIPLVPTVLQLDLLAATARELLGDSGALVIRSIEVLDAVTVPDAPLTMHVCAQPVAAIAADVPEGWRLELRSETATHLRAFIPVAVPEEHGARPLGEPNGHEGRLSRGAQEVYPPMFHGPVFQVVGSFDVVDGAVVVQPAAGVPDWSLLADGPVLPTALLELVFQSCGVWELEHTGRMMRPRWIDEVSVALSAVPSNAFDSPTATPTTPGTPIVRVRPRSADPTLPRCFDGVATDARGHRLVEVRGYRPTELAVGHEGDL